MSNELVPVSPEPVEGTQWNVPPLDVVGDDYFSEERRAPRGLKAERDAEAAKRRGDDGFAYLREEDAHAERQGRWDKGDLRTWLIIFAIAVIGVVLCASAYFFPAGPHAGQPNIKVY